MSVNRHCQASWGPQPMGCMLINAVEIALYEDFNDDCSCIKMVIKFFSYGERVLCFSATNKLTAVKCLKMFHQLASYYCCRQLLWTDHRLNVFPVTRTKAIFKYCFAIYQYFHLANYHSNFVFYFICIYCICCALSYFLYIVRICDFGYYHCVLHCTIQPTDCKSYNKRLS